MLRPSKRQAMESSTCHEEMENAQTKEGLSEMKDQHAEQVIMDSRWEDFLPELHQIVLRFIPIPELCRFRTVSREWNNLTNQFSFASQSQLQEAMFIFRTLDTMELQLGLGTTAVWRNPQRRWRIYDPNTQKSFKLSMEFLHEGVRDRFNVWDDCVTLAADKGFVSVMWFSASPNRRKTIQVANPITHSVVEIPPFILNNSFDMTTPNSIWMVSLVIAEDYSAFTLYYLLERDFVDPEKKYAFRFQSNVGEWREIPQPPGALTPGHILKLGLTLFTLFVDMTSDVYQPQLLAFDTTRDAWSDTGVRLPHDVWRVRLATARGRLFFVAFGILDGVDGVMLVEIDVASTKCNLVASLDHRHDFNGFFEEVYKLTLNTLHVLVVVGCGDFIVFSCTSGAALAYDLVSSKWCEWTENKMMTSLADGNTIISSLVDGELCYGMYATTMSLTLNLVPMILK